MIRELANFEMQRMDVFGRPASLWGKILGSEEGIEDVVEKMKRPYNEHADAEHRRARLQDRCAAPAAGV